jgi:hypothetical protein
LQNLCFDWKFALWRRFTCALIMSSVDKDSGRESTRCDVVVLLEMYLVSSFHDGELFDDRFNILVAVSSDKYQKIKRLSPFLMWSRCWQRTNLSSRTNVCERRENNDLFDRVCQKFLTVLLLSLVLKLDYSYLSFFSY